MKIHFQSIFFRVTDVGNGELLKIFEQEGNVIKAEFKDS